MTAALTLIALAALAALAARRSRPRRARHGPRAVGSGRARLRLDLRLPAPGRRDLHHLHLSRRFRLLLRAGGSGLLHPGLRLARLRDRLFPAAPDLELRQAERAALAAGFLRSKVCEPDAGCAGLGRRSGGADPLSGAAAHRPRHHRHSGKLRRHPQERGDLDRRRDRHGLCHDVRHPRLGLYGGGQGHPDPWRGALPRHLSAAASLWRHRADVRTHRRSQARVSLSSRQAGRASHGSSPPCS